MVTFMMLLLSIGCETDKVSIEEMEKAEEEATSQPPVFSKSDLERSSNLWFELAGNCVEYYRLKVSSVPTYRFAYAGNVHQTDLVITCFENKTNGMKAGFFNFSKYSNGIDVSLADLKEFIIVLESVEKQIKNETCLYSCTRRYSTSRGFVIIYNYSQKEGWQDVNISLGQEKIEIQPKYIANYIAGLKECVNSIEGFVQGKWNNIGK